MGDCIAIRVDANPRMGAGHAMRCLALADACKSLGAEIRILSAGLLPDIERRIARAGHRLTMLDIVDPDANEPGWDTRQRQTAAQQDDAEASLRALADTDLAWIVLDHYRLHAPWERRVATSGARVLVIDDLVNRLHDCDMLLDSTYRRTADEYAALAPNARILAGTSYALLRPEFADACPVAFERRTGLVRGGSVVVSLGSTDIGGMSGMIAQALLDGGADAIDVIMTSASESLEQCRALARDHNQITLHLDCDDIVPILLTADVAIGAGGGSAWERSSVGLPSVMLTVAENQRGVAKALESAHAAILARNPYVAVREALALINDPHRREVMAAAAFAVTDGRGARRVARLLTSADPPSTRDISVRTATAADSRNIWLWRNDWLMRAMAKTQAPIRWADHAAWYDRAIDDQATSLLIGERAGEPLAMVRFDRDGEHRIVSVNVAPHARGRGLGRQVLERAIRAQKPGDKLVAHVREDNRASRQLFERAGFVPAGLAADSHLIYRRSI